MTQFTFEQDDVTHTVTPLTFPQAVRTFYGDSDTETSTSLERSDHSFVFFYQPEGGGPVSLVFIHDVPGDNSGGAVTFQMTFSGSASDAEWIVEDDPGDFLLGRSNPNWAWNDRNKDGGVLQGGFGGNFELRIDPAFNDAARRNPLTPGRLTDWKVLSGGESNTARNPVEKPLNRGQQLRIHDGTGSGGEVTATTSTLSFIPGEDEDSLGSATGSPLNSAVMDVFDRTHSFEFSVDGELDLPFLGDFSVDWDVLEVFVTPAFDSWGTGDEIPEDPADDLDEATDPKLNKYRDEFPSEAHEQFRILNTVEVSFATTDGGGIDESSVSVGFDEEFSRTVLEAEDVNTLDPQAIGAKSQETENGTSYFFEGQGKVRYSDWEVVEVDGVDAVQASTIVGGHTAVAKELIDVLRESPSVIQFLHDVVGWEFRVGGEPVEDVVEAIPEPVRSALESKFSTLVGMLAATPNIYTFLEFTLLADGRRFVRLWDASAFPKHALYLEGDQFGLTELPYSPRENFNGNFAAFLADAASRLVTPYHAPREAYEAHLRNGAFADDPRLQYEKYASFVPVVDADDVVNYLDVRSNDGPVIEHGERADGSPIGPDTIDALLDDTPFFPWG